jgi:hypothetical protein
MMNARPPYQSPYQRQTSGPLSYQSPGAHQNSQWVTDEGVGGRILVMILIVLSVIGAVLGGVVALIGFLLGWW